MNTDYKIKNFRIFDNDGALVDIRPVTILTGCNNSGKSSIVKSICLLKDFCSQAILDYEDGKKLRLENYKMDFHKRPMDVLGSFKHILHKGESSSDYVTLELVVDSKILMQDVILSLEFGTLDGDDLCNGYLHSYAIKTLEGKTIFTSKYKDGCDYNFSLVKKSLLHFIYTQHAVADWQSAYSYREATLGDYNCEKEGEAFNKTLKNLYSELGYRAAIEMLEWQVSHCLYSWRDNCSGSARALMNVDESFCECAVLGVYTYFPFMSEIADWDKTKIITFINDKLSSSKLSSLDKAMVALFLKEFKSSSSTTIHDFVSCKENSILFDGGVHFNFNSHLFQLPIGGIFNRQIGVNIADENDLPDEITWEILLIVLDLIDHMFTCSDKSYIFYDEINGYYSHTLENSVNDLFEKVIEDIFIQAIPGDVYYSGTSVVNVKRMYSLEEENEFADTLKMYFESKRLLVTAQGSSRIKNGYVPCTFVDKWIAEFQIGHHVGIFTHAEGNGVTIRVFKDKDDKEGMLLADKGYGVVQLFIILLKIEIAIIKSEYLSLRHTYDTHGINDALIEGLRSYTQLHPITIALEEPENHLHPSFQSKLADLIVDAYENYGIHFLVESHSEYFIRKLQLLVSRQSIDYNNVSLLYVNSSSRPKYKDWVETIGMDKTGKLINEFGPGFFDESVNLANDLYKIKEVSDEE